MSGLIKRAIARVASEPLVVLGVTIAAVNTATDQTPRGYIEAVVVALVRFIVTGPFGELPNAGA